MKNYAKARRLAESINWSNLRGVRKPNNPLRHSKPQPKRAATAAQGKGAKANMRWMLQLGRDWERQNHWARVQEHAPSWDGKQRLVSPAKVFTIRKEKG